MLQSALQCHRHGELQPSLITIWQTKKQTKQNAISRSVIRHHTLTAEQEVNYDMVN